MPSGAGVLSSFLKLLFSQANRARAPEDRDRFVRMIVQFRARRLKKAWAAGTTASNGASKKRAIRAKSRQGIRLLKRRKTLSLARQKILLRKYRKSKILDHILPDRENQWVPIKLRAERKTIPAINLHRFSFLDDPRSTLAYIAEIARMEASENAALIHFKDHYCLDVAPFVLLSEFWDEVAPIFRGGEMSAPVQKVIAKVGLHSALHMGLRGLTGLEDVWAFLLRRRRPTGKTRSETRLFDVQTRETVSDEFCIALDEWLDGLDKGLCLTQEGRSWIKTIFGEMLDNAERHSDGNRRDGNWAVAGFMARRARTDEPDSDHEFVCHLGFVNLGDSFSESLARATEDTKDRIEAYVSSCKAKGCRTSPETLRTLFAIQDGVTCVQQAEKEQRGGVGLQEMLDMVNMLGQTRTNGLSTRVTIVSGHSCIMLRAPYIEAGRRNGDDNPRVLWCNAGNTSSEPPSDEFVFDLDHHVPGTIISVGFTLDPEFLDGNDDGRNQSGGVDEERSSQPVGS